jgi:rhamnosyl/mannosyltransferase
VRVLHVYRTYFPDPPGGLQEAIRQIALATRPLGVESRIFTLSPQPTPPLIDRPEGRVIRRRSWLAPASCDLGGYAALQAFRAEVAWADLVHYYFPWPFADLLHWLAPVRKPAMMTYVSDIVRQRWMARCYAPLMRRTLQAMQAIVAVAPAYARTSAVLAAPSCRKRLHTIPLGIVEESYQDAIAASSDIDPALHFSQPFRALAKHCKPGTRLTGAYFLAIGVLRYYKGLHVLVEAAASSGLPVVIAGDGPEKAALEQRAQTLNAPVVFLGRISDVEKMALLRDCRALVLPSHLRSEAFGMVLVEAAMMSRPLISCEIGTGTSYVNKHEETGLVVPPSSPEALAAAMRTLDMNAAMCRTYGANARARYEKLFAGPQLGKAYAQLYQAILGHKATRSRSVESTD